MSTVFLSDTSPKLSRQPEAKDSELDQVYTHHRTGPRADGRGCRRLLHRQAGAATTNAGGRWICAYVGWQRVGIVCAVGRNGGEGGDCLGRSGVDVSE